MDGVQSITITMELRQLQALFKLTQRAPMSDAEACFTEDLFSGFFQQVQDQRNQMQALARMTELASAAPAEAGPLEVPDQPTQESPPDVPSEPLPYDGVEHTVN